ncbi:MAG: hypothetical protein R2856_14235 [Caldilineaceae bacterium]
MWFLWRGVCLLPRHRQPHVLPKLAHAGVGCAQQAQIYFLFGEGVDQLLQVPCADGVRPQFQRHPLTAEEAVGLAEMRREHFQHLRPNDIFFGQLDHHTVAAPKDAHRRRAARRDRFRLDRCFSVTGYLVTGACLIGDGDIASAGFVFGGFDVGRRCLGSYSLLLLARRR